MLDCTMYVLRMITSKTLLQVIRPIAGIFFFFPLLDKSQSETKIHRKAYEGAGFGRFSIHPAEDAEDDNYN